MASPSLNHGLVDGKEYQLKLGTSFQGNKAPESYHLLRYDFKPGSVDTSQPAEVHIGTNNECTVNIPKDSGVTTYKGGKKPCTKECILIIDKETGEITLERFSSTIPLKKSRANRAMPNASLNKTATKSSSSSTANKASTSTFNSQTSSSSQASSKSQGNSQLTANLNSPLKAPAAPTTVTGTSHPTTQQPTPVKRRDISTTSTSDSSSSDSSDSDSEAERESAAQLEAFSTKSYEPPPPPTKAYEPPPPPTTTAPAPAPTKGSGLFMSTLHSDLQLSDDESDSDED